MEVLDNHLAVRSALQYIRPDIEYSDWVKVGFALISEFGREEGGEIFDQWSQGGEKYNQSVVRSVIRSANPNGGVKIGTLFHIAKRYGYDETLSKSEAGVNRHKIKSQKPSKQNLTEDLDSIFLATSQKALTIWNEASPASTSNPYIQKKQIPVPATLREIRLDLINVILGYYPRSGDIELSGDTVLVAPIWVIKDGQRVMSNIELIDSKSKKTALHGRGTKKGGYWSVSELPEVNGAGEIILIGEGVATVLSAHEATGFQAVASLSSSNMTSVAELMQSLYPKAEIIILADIGNGQVDAEKAAKSIGCKIAIPVLPEGANGKDFNDMKIVCGLDAVKNTISGAINIVDVWDEPESLTANLEKLDYPLHALPEKIRDAVVEFSNHAKAPIPLISSSALATISIVTQAHIDVRRDEVLENPVSLFILTIADSGERKSTCDKHFMKIVRDYDDEQECLFKPELDNYRADSEIWEAKRSALKSKIQEYAKKNKDTRVYENDLRCLEKEKPTPPRIPKLIYGDATPEALAFDLSTKWPSGGVMSSEAATIFGGHAMNPDSIMRSLGQLNIMWDGGELPINRRTSESYTIRDVRLTIGLMVQETTLQEFYRKSGKLSRGTGFMARFLVAHPESTQGSRFYTEPPSAWPARDRFNKRIKEILSQLVPINEAGRLEPKMATFSHEAKSYWKDFYNDIESGLGIDGELHDVRDVAAKTADNAARLAAIFQFFEDGSLVIGLDSIKSACEIAAWHLNESRRFFGEITLPDDLAELIQLDNWLLEFSRKKQSGTISTTDIMQCVTPIKLRKKESLSPLLKLLEDKKRIRIKSNSATKRVQINPSLIRGDLWH